MAKESMKAREVKRAKLVAKYAEKKQSVALSFLWLAEKVIKRRPTILVLEKEQCCGQANATAVRADMHGPIGYHLKEQRELLLKSNNCRWKHLLLYVV